MATTNATFVIEAEAIDKAITVDWDISGTELSYYPTMKLYINEIGKSTGKNYYTISLDSSNYSGGSYTITDISGVPLTKGASYSIYGTLTGSRTKKLPIKSNSVIVQVLQSEPVAPTLIVTGGDSTINIKVTNMYDSSANQGFTPVTLMWISVTNDLTGEDRLIIYDASASGYDQTFFNETITFDGSNNQLYEGIVTIFNEKGSAETAFSVIPSNLPDPVQNIAAYPTVMYNVEKGLTTDASSITLFWQRPANYSELNAAGKLFTNYVITRTRTDVSDNDVSFNFITISNPSATFYDENYKPENFNDTAYDNKFTDTTVVIGRSYSYSIVLYNENGSSENNPSSLPVICGSLPSTPIFSLDPSDNKFTFNLTTGSSLNGFDQSANKLYTLNFNYDSTSNASAIFDLSAGSLVTMTNLPSNNTLNNGISIMNGTTYQLTMYASTTYSINGLTTIFTSDPYILSVRPYGIPSAPSKVLVFSLDSSTNPIPVTDASDNPGLKVSWDSVTGTNLRGNTNATYSVYVNGNLSNIQDVDNSAGNYIVSSYTYNGSSVELLLGTKYSIYVVTKTLNEYYDNREVYSTEIPSDYFYSGTPLTYPSPVTDMSLNNLSATSMQVTFTEVSGNDNRGGFDASNIQYTFELFDLSTNQTVINSGTITTGSKNFDDNLTPGNPYRITVYTQGLYTSTDTSSNSGHSQPVFTNVVVSNSDNKAVATKILYFTPAAPENVIVNATYESQTYGATLSWDSPPGLVNNMSNGVTLTHYQIYCVEASYSGSLTDVTFVKEIPINDPRKADIINYSTGSGTILAMDLSGNYKVYVLAKGSVGGYTKLTYYTFLTEYVYGNPSNNMYNRLLENPLTSSPISYITTFENTSVPSLSQTVTESNTYLYWPLDESVTEYIIYKNSTLYAKYFWNNDSFTGLITGSSIPTSLTLTTTSGGVNNVNFLVTLTGSYSVTSVLNNVESDSNTFEVSTAINRPDPVTEISFSVANKSITVSWKSPSYLGDAGINGNGNLSTVITLYDSSNNSTPFTFYNVTESSVQSNPFYGLDNNTKYKAVITSYFTIKNGGFAESDPVSKENMIPNAPPANVDKFTATGNDSSVSLTWDSPQDFNIYPFAPTFTILRTGKRGDGIPSSIIDASISILSSESSYTDDNVNNGYEYMYKLIANRNGTVVTSNTTTSTSLQPSGTDLTSVVIPSGKPQFASTIDVSNNNLTFTVTIDKNGAPLTGSSFIGIPTDESATALLFDSSNTVFEDITYVSSIPGDSYTSEVLAGQLYTYTFGFGVPVSAVFLAVSNKNGMVTGTNSSTSFINASDTSI